MTARMHVWWLLAVMCVVGAITGGDQEGVWDVEGNRFRSDDYALNFSIAGRWCTVGGDLS